MNLKEKESPLLKFGEERTNPEYTEPNLPIKVAMAQEREPHQINQIIAQEANLIIALGKLEYNAEELCKIMEQHKNSVIALSKVHNDHELSKIKEKEKIFAFILSEINIFLPLYTGIDRVIAISIASIGATGFATSLYSFFGAKAFEAGKKFRNLFSLSRKERNKNATEDQ